MAKIEVPRDIVAKLSNKWWRLNNLYWIIDKDGEEIPFKCNEAQEKFYDDLWYFNLLLKARQWGGTTFTDIYFLDECLFNNNIEAGIIAHNKDDAQKIFRRKVAFPYSKLPDWLKDQRKLVTDSRSELAFSNGSVIYVATSVRSATVQLLHISEYGKICRKYPDKAQEIQTGSLNAVHPGQIIVIESTAEGAYGEFYDMCQAARNAAKEEKKLTKLDYKFHFVPWFVEPSYRISAEDVIISDEMQAYFDELAHLHDIELDEEQKAWYVKKYNVLFEKMYQEFPSTPEEAFQASIKGAYFSYEMSELRQRHGITTVPYEPSLPVNTAWDLGINDETVIVFHQKHRLENRVVDYYENHSLGLSHYTKVLGNKPYTYGVHYFPHDIEVKELGTGKSRMDVLRDLMPGQDLRTVPRIHDIADGIEAIRGFIPSCWIDEKKCNKLIKALDNYQREWDKRYGRFQDKPLHNWASHPVDGFRTLAMGIDSYSSSRGSATGFTNWDARSEIVRGKQLPFESDYQEYWT
jgi:hypothetical protein